ncbi:hypothetical protein GMD78_02910 [Ornithinibacillus sp. L9]|uniref:Uncharacterized protein n=1 Tax=Ornithinibacillus caprae TaxID=2678566 RepID=A0A6N8FDS7_9BACI|nr:hypothetical protein [Ornithinibacillus caprae]MUK87351.1 hypothetical protein [Ornithinibacillus caprae]
MESASKDREQITKNDLDKIFAEQKRYYNLIKLELEIFNLENQYNNKSSENREMLEKIERYEKEINLYKSSLHSVSEEQQYYLKEYNKILNSTSWKVMAPMRMVGSVFKGITGRRNKR